MDTKQTIEQESIKLLFGIVGAVLTVLIMKKMMGPDIVKTAKMRLYLGIKNGANKQAEIWAGISSHAANMYDIARL